MTDAARNPTTLPMTALSYVGSRPYIRGADLLVAFVEAAGADIRDLELLRFAREIEHDGRWQSGAVAGAAATLDFCRDDGQRERVSFLEVGQRITARVPDIPSRLLALERSGEFAGHARVGAVAGLKEFLDAMIEANKRLHQQTLDDRRQRTDAIRFVYLERLPLKGLAFDRDTTLDIRFVGERQRSGQHFTLVDVHCPRLRAPVRLCYSTAPAAA